MKDQISPSIENFKPLIWSFKFHFLRATLPSNVRQTEPLRKAQYLFLFGKGIKNNRNKNS